MVKVSGKLVNIDLLQGVEFLSKLKWVTVSLPLWISKFCTSLYNVGQAKIGVSQRIQGKIEQTRLLGRNDN